MTDPNEDLKGTELDDVFEENLKLLRTVADLAKRLVAIRKLVDEQAESTDLWFPLSVGREAHLQAALRKLHALIEADLQ